MYSTLERELRRYIDICIFVYVNVLGTGCICTYICMCKYMRIYTSVSYMGGEVEVVYMYLHMCMYMRMGVHVDTYV